MIYEERINRAIEFIGKNLDQDLTLEQLSQVTCFSKYHFHRLFTSVTCLSLQQYIRWLRLKRAAHQLMIEKNSTIIEIALNAGFKSHASFTRAFKQICGQTPSEFRLHHNWNVWEKSPYCLPQTKEDRTMNVTIKNMNARRLAAVEHRGSLETLADSLNKLMRWKEEKNLKLKPGEAFGFAYDDPKTTVPQDFRFDLMITVPNGVEIKGDVVEKHLPQGRYAVTMHKGSRDNIGDTIYKLYRDWLPTSHEELGDLPLVFCYHNFDHEVAETEALTEVCLLLK